MGKKEISCEFLARILFANFAMLMLAGATTAQEHSSSQSPSTEVTLIAGGDVVWTQSVRRPNFYFGVENKESKFSNDGWRGIPYVANPEIREFLEEKFQRNFETNRTHFRTAIQYGLTFPSETARLSHPFKKIKKLLEQEDIAFINLETPLSDEGRQSGAFRMPEAFAKTLASSGIDIVSTANNHSFDAEGKGIVDTMRALDGSGVAYIGTGKNLMEAASAKIHTVNGQKFAFLAFTYGVNPTITPLGFATENRSGAAPMDPNLIKSEIAKVRDTVDFVIVSLHWGLENKPKIHPEARKFAHAIMDSGADVILGHHPHIPKGVERYKNGVIIYSMGNLIFGHSHKEWEDNFLVRFTFANSKISGVQFIPIAGAGIDVTQPFVLTGKRANDALHKIKTRSAALGTDIQVDGRIGRLSFQQ